MREVGVLDLTFEADAQLAEGTIAALDSNGRATTAAADSLLILGVVQENNGATAPYQARVRVQGVARVKSDGSGAIAVGDKLTAGSSGKAKTRNPASGTNARSILGIALSSATATADLYVDVLLAPGWYVGA